MKYGYFDDPNKEYVIEQAQTPYPWINYLGNRDFFSIISNTAGGYSFYQDARLRRLTRYRYNNVPLDEGGKYFYINDGGSLWSPGWKPLKTNLDFYECRHGMGYTKIKSKKDNLSTDLLFFVPMEDNVEIQQITLKNESNATKKVKLHSFVEWCFWNSLDDMTNFQRNYNIGEVEVEDNTIYHKTEYRERRNHYAFYSVNQDITGFDTDRESFIGLYNGFDAPEQVMAGTSTNSIALGWSPIASHFFDIELQAGESRTFIFCLGYAENNDSEKFIAPNILNKAKAKSIVQKYATTEAVAQAFEDLASYWTEKLSYFTIESSDDKLNRMVNIWNQYQCMVTYLFSRSASYFESGIGRGMGFRDSNQDLLGVVHNIPKRARQRILDIAATQLEDGSAYHQYQPLTKKGNHDIGGNFNDDPLWLVIGVAEYLKETGDWSLLDEQAAFNNNEQNTASIYEHIKRSLQFTMNNLGPHGLPLIGRADWNDCLNLNCFSTQPDEAFQTTENKSGDTKAESVFIAAMFLIASKEFQEICAISGKTEEAKPIQDAQIKMENSIKNHGWDGDWFLRAYDYFGEKVGSHENEEAQIFIEPQGFCIMAGMGLEDGRAQKALQSVNERLACSYGIVLNNPPLTKYYINLGEISTYPPGYKENAGIFCHNNPWIMIAETMVGNKERAFDYYKRITPAYIEDISEIHRTEPYVYAQMIAGKDARKPGEAKNSWLTGTAAWNFHAITQYIIGIRHDYNGLQIDPKLPESLKEIKINRKFRGAEYEIYISTKNSEQPEIRVDGQKIDGNIIPVFEAGTRHIVEVTQ